LSNVRATSAMPDRARLSPPAKIISEVDLARSMLMLRSPSAQRMASAMLLLPVPLGPTIAVMPCGNSNSVLLAKDL